MRGRSSNTSPSEHSTASAQLLLLLLLLLLCNGCGVLLLLLLLIPEEDRARGAPGPKAAWRKDRGSGSTFLKPLSALRANQPDM